VVVGTIWQTALVALPIYVVLMKTIPIIVCVAIIVATSLFLKRTWWDRLDEANWGIEQKPPETILEKAIA
jgi:hypothetical protein